MDYTRTPPGFRLRKAARYVRLYGPRRTVVKIRGQYHMRSPERGVGGPPTPGRADAHVGLIGCGNFAFSHIAYFLHKNVGAVMRGAMDVEPARAASLARRYDLHYATDDADRVLEDPAIDLVYIASNHASHAEYAIRALAAGKDVHIEKPHVVDDDQLERLREAMESSPRQVRLGFNRPDSQLGREVRSLLAAQPGSSVLNWFVAGHELEPDHWYHRPDEGGRVLGNLCHWTDFVLQMVPPENRYPLRIVPARAASSDSNVAITYVFADGTLAVISFSAKGHAFEGVREHLSAHRGDLLLSLTDFARLDANVGVRRITRRPAFRDHGHEDAILRSYRMSAAGGGTTPGASPRYVWETANLFLRTREALQRDESLVVEPPAVPGPAVPVPDSL